ncbi:unnamed protein product, partial [Prunus brigantina]
MMMSSIIFIIFASLWTCHDAASDTLKPGDTLNSSSSLVSASGKFILGFVVQNIDGFNTSYLAIQRNKSEANKAWIGNRNTPIPYPSSPLLTLDLNNTLKITYPGGDPIVISSAPQTSVVVATLLDSGNFILQERYNFSIVSNENEDYLTYTAVGDPSDPEPEWVLYSRGTLVEYGTQVAITKAQICDGYNTGGGCMRMNRPSNCMSKFGDGFQLKNGYFKSNNSINTSRSPTWF